MASVGLQGHREDMYIYIYIYIYTYIYVCVYVCVCIGTKPAKNSSSRLCKQKNFISVLKYFTRGHYHLNSTLRATCFL